MIILSDSLIQGKEYKVKYEDEKRATTLTYVGEYQAYTENEQGEIVKDKVVAEFNGTGGTRFYNYENITSAIEVDPTKKKARKLRTCDRCNGHGYMEHVSHVEGGQCFKCRGNGKL